MASPSWKRSVVGSPPRQASREASKPIRNGYSPRRPSVTESPSRQLLEEFNRLLLSEDQTLQQRLSERADRQELHHMSVLAEAATEHDRIRRNAERARERVELEIERERKRREDEEAHALEHARRAKVEEELQLKKKEKERLEKQDEERRRRLAAEKEIEETKARHDELKQKEAAEAAKRKTDKEAADRMAKENAAASAARARQQAQTSTPLAAAPAQASAAPLPSDQLQLHSHPAPTPSAPSQQIIAAQGAAGPGVTSRVERENTHKRYLEAHRSLKQMRSYVMSEGKKIPALKTKLGDWRREIKKCMGQLTTEKGMNRKPTMEIIRILRESLKYSEPSVDLAPFLVSYPTDGQQVRISGAFIYLINIFAKSVVAQFMSEASVSAKAADPIGVIAVTIFATPDLKFNGNIPLIDVLLAKYHVCCPVLWGIYGNQNTASGRARIGWWKEDGQWVGEQRHIERMTGLAAGYAALSLRDFSKSKNENPFPNTNYWKAFSCIINTPPDQVQPTHFTVLKGLVDGSVPRFIGFYGAAAYSALKVGLIDFPARSPKSVAASQVQILPEVLKRDMHLTLQ